MAFYELHSEEEGRSVARTTHRTLIAGGSLGRLSDVPACAVLFRGGEGWS